MPHLTWLAPSAVRRGGMPPVRRRARREVPGDKPRGKLDREQRVTVGRLQAEGGDVGDGVLGHAAKVSDAPDSLGVARASPSRVYQSSIRRGRQLAGPRR